MGAFGGAGDVRQVPRRSTLGRKTEKALDSCQKYIHISFYIEIKQITTLDQI